jgi:predicted nucleic acid-binding protein
VRAAGRSAGRPIERQDAWIAATALYLDLPLVTHNARHFASVPGLQLITEPDPAP